ncbi:MAG: IS200/IS605 family transposase [Bacteroidia bacterium]|jgi:REP element-mobilizing transposase RayT|nr:IS200/IS605 family transposase [Bacteroidia bacterium]
MSYIRIWVHSVWTTKNRVPFLTDRIRNDVIHHILNYAKSKGIFIDVINGHVQHLHALISLGGSQNISDLMKLIKGESSHWINKNKLTRLRFEWQDDFWSISVGEYELENIRKYIRGQEEHHRKMSLEEEIKKLLGQNDNLEKESEE